MNKLKCISITLAVIAAVAVQAYPNTGRIVFRVFVEDERSGLPMEKVPVTGVFTDIPIFWGGESKERAKTRKTDAKGFCRFKGTSNHGSAGYKVEKVDGYYQSPEVDYKATNTKPNFSPFPYKCEPYDRVYTTVLQRIENPIPLYVKNVHAKDSAGRLGGFDGTNALMKFDFLAGDWMPPYGKGEYEDMRIQTLLAITDDYVDGSWPLVFYSFTNSIVFPGEGNGLFEEDSSVRNMGLRIRTAPSSGFKGGKTLHFGLRKDVVGPNIYTRYYTQSNNDRCYSFRIRSRFNEKGELIGGYYGKIYKDFNFEGTYKSGLKEISFIYYLNPAPLDRNLEWDMKNNLCTEPGNLRNEP